MIAFVGKSRYKHDLMGCLATFPQVDAAHKPSVFLDNKGFISSGKNLLATPLQALMK